MYRILVVDDEFNTRDAIVHTIRWETIGAEAVGSAVDGEDALELTKQLKPDIVITDVSMEKLDGLDLTDVLRREYPFIKVIIISGYDDFEFVQRAIELKVASYIIKPVESERLIEAVKNVIAELEQERKLKQKINLMEKEIDLYRPVLLERFLYDLLNGNIKSAAEYRMQSSFLNIQFFKSHYVCILVAIAEREDIIRNFGVKKLQNCLFSIREIFLNDMHDFETWPLSGNDGSIVFLTGCDCESRETFHDRLIDLTEQLTENITNLLRITPVVSIGGICDSILDVSKSCREATLAEEYNSISGETGIIHIDDVSAAVAHYDYPIEKEDMLLSSFPTLSVEKTGEILGELFDEMQRQGCSEKRMRINIMGLLGRISRKAMDMGVDIYQLYDHNLLDPFTVLKRYHSREQIENWLRNIICKTVEEIRSQKEVNVKSAIVKANKFLQENYADPKLSLASVSQYLFLNPSYFSRMYKKETGESFIKTITKIRINKAEKLLKESNQKISTIAKSTGYPNPKYFCAVFKKITGLTPIEFREI